jgi:ubiquinol-cytochrome c reductase iron-sulfur subunit
MSADKGGCGCLDEERRRRADVAIRRASVCFLVTAAACVGLAIVYWQGGQPQAEGVLLAVAFGALASGLVMLANRVTSTGPHVGPRHPMPSPDADVQHVEQDLARGEAISRRTALRRSLVAAVVAMGGAALFPLRSLGPNPGNALKVTPWRRGLRLVTEDGEVARADEIPLDDLLTVFPEGHAGSPDGQAVLVRVRPHDLHQKAGREGWAPDGLIVYSKLCTHAGCPVGLYEATSHELLCPCHQSTFDVLHGAEPTGGPAAAALPQLPIRITEDGALEATGGFSDPVGPAFWSER